VASRRLAAKPFIHVGVGQAQLFAERREPESADLANGAHPAIASAALILVV
jgi:hypothetical protein